MKSNFYSTNKLLFLLLIFILFSCEKKNNYDFYDTVKYYHSDFYKIPEPQEHTKRFDIYYSNFVDENYKAVYKDLSEFGFKKYPIDNEFSLKIDEFFTNQNPGSFMPDPRCLNCFQDVMVFYKKEKLVGIAKFDFKCNKYYFTNFLSDKEIYLRKDCQKFNYLFKK